MTAPAVGHRLPLFRRIFWVMLVAVLGAQILDFGLLLLIPPPAPTLYPVAEVARALESGQGTADLRIAVVASPPGADDDPHADRLRAELAQRLGSPEAAVRLDLDHPPLWMPMAHRLIRPPYEHRQAHEALLFDHFTAALRLPDGRWREVRPIGRGIQPWHWRMLFWLLCSLLAVAPFAWLVSRRVAAPIGLFAAAAEAVGRDPRGPPLPLDGPPEVAVAARAFNEMRARIGRYVEDRVTMVAAIAHDLRTPLMRLALRVEEAPPAARHAMEADIADMKAMIAGALAFVRDTHKPARRQRLDLRSLVESVAEGMADCGDPVRVLPGPDMVIEAEVAGLKALVANLIGNAVAYGGSAEVAVHRDARHAVIEVTDRGLGIPDTELERVFEPFHRLEPSRNRETGGIGLGLASARAVARAHGGDVTLANRRGGGLSAMVVLPL